MPTILRVGPYRFYFSHEPNEAPHIHDRGNDSAKFWLNPVRFARNIGFAAHELRNIERFVVQCELELLEAWNGYFRASTDERVRSIRSDDDG